MSMSFGRRLLAACLIMCLGSACGSTDESGPAEAESLTLEETLVIGSDDPEAPDAHLFSIVSTAAVTPDGRMLVVDGRSEEIRLFSPDGTFIRRIGERGAGPGEIQRVGAMAVDGQNRLLVADPRQGRITAFSLEGEMLQTYPFPEVPRVTSLHPMPDGRVLVSGYTEAGMVHMTDTSFASVDTSLIAPDEIKMTDHDMERVVTQWLAGNAAVLDDGRVAYAPALFDGRVFVLDETEGRWRVSDTWTRPVGVDEPATITARDQAERVDLPIRIQGRGNFAAQLRSLSIGLFPRAGGALLVSMEEAREGHHVMMTQFGADGAVSGEAAVDTVQGIAMDALAFDGASLYLSDRTEVPVLRRMRVR